MRILIVGGGIADVERRRFLDDRGRLLFEFDEASLWRPVALPIALPRRDLHRILAEGASGIPIRFGMTVTTIADSGDAVDVAFTDGTAGRFDLVIGADGIHSTVRRLVLHGPAARLAGQVAWRYLVDGHPEITGWNGWLGPDRSFLALALGNGRVYCYGDVRATAPSDPTGGDPTAFTRLFASFAEPVPALLGAVGGTVELHFSPIEEVTPPTFVKGRVVLIGDAAHASSPNMAEGASMALEDALLLADGLATGADLPSALEAFVSRRVARVQWVQDKTHARDRLRYLPPWLRAVVMRSFGKRTSRAHYRLLLERP